MDNLEKNEVNIEKLFGWGKEFQLDLGDESIPVYVRLVGDADWNKARVKALRASSELRKKLRSPDSDEAIAFLPDYDSVEKDRLVDLLLAINIRNLTDKVTSEIVLKIPVEPKSDATLEEQEKYQEEIDGYPTKRKDEIEKRLNLELDKERKKLEKLSKDVLQKEYTATLVNSMCELEMGKTFYDYCTYYGTFKDNTYKDYLFETFDDFLNSKTSVKEQLVSFYRSMELGISELKK